MKRTPLSWKISMLLGTVIGWLLFFLIGTLSVAGIVWGWRSIFG